MHRQRAAPRGASPHTAPPYRDDRSVPSVCESRLPFAASARAFSFTHVRARVLLVVPRRAFRPGRNKAVPTRPRITLACSHSWLGVVDICSPTCIPRDSRDQNQTLASCARPPALQTTTWTSARPASSPQVPNGALCFPPRTGASSACGFRLLDRRGYLAVAAAKLRPSSPLAFFSHRPSLRTTLGEAYLGMPDAIGRLQGWLRAWSSNADWGAGALDWGGMETQRKRAKAGSVSARWGAGHPNTRC
ncbi:hypothetical protein FA95DRAFT_1002888 [Auriscalpium vulgare]|uniref:Uncharacterized protein n=1 Tax=Auriscalpium vulgare TaxID=40419 RepID=A0ACB8R658_9AGAM|nr:hypothetical protein FA95DRAFT_1002888 [Auriscalpium vulgare]